MNQQLYFLMMSKINRHLKKSELNSENFESVKNNCISAFLYSSPLEPKEQLSNYKNLCEEKIALVIKYIKNGDVPSKKKVVWQSDRMCLIQKNQAASSETTATRSEDMSPISTETTKQPPALTTRYVGRTSCRAYRRRMIVPKDQKTSLPKPVKSEVTAPPPMPIVPKPTEIPGTSSPAGFQRNAFLTTDKAYLLLDYKKTIHEPDKTSNKIDVPLWSERPFKGKRSKLEGTENINEDVFIARHKKCEKDERWSKKWDNRRLREQNATEKQKNATEKQKNKQSRKNKGSAFRKSQSFYPDLKKLEFLEVTEELPILAFGYPIPFFDPSEFSLPWQAEGVTEAPKAKRGRPSVT